MNEEARGEERDRYSIGLSNLFDDVLGDARGGVGCIVV